MNGKKLDYLEEERKKLWAEIESLKHLKETIPQISNQIDELKDAVSKKTSDYEKEARSASKSASTFRNRAFNTHKEAIDFKSEIEQILQEAERQSARLAEISQKHTDILAKDEDVQSAYSKIKQSLQSVDSTIASVAEALTNAKSALAQAQASKVKMDDLELGAETASKRMSSLQTQAVKEALEIKTLYDVVFGYTHEDETTGEKEEVEGLKTKLDETYEGLKKSIDETQEWLALFETEQKEKFKEFKSKKNEEFEKLKTKISSLLPDAMTAGLSHAYQAKREAEEREIKKASRSFGWSIFFLSATSIIPVAVSLYHLNEGNTLEQIIKNLPNLSVGILPLYAPLFWLAMSANKRVKLAKRLIEEYAHKEALSKTFEGLSTQIASMDDDELAKDLRTRLLYNMVSLSAENPGSLIPDFNESDNPLFEALNKSLSLGQSLEKISAIPGIQLILKKVVNTQIEKQEKMVESVKKATEVNVVPEPVDAD